MNITAGKAIVAAVLLLLFTSYTGCVHTDKHILTAEDEALLQATKIIKFELKDSTWRDKVSYDIYNSAKENLEKVGFKVVLADSKDYDAILTIDYNEIKGVRCYVQGRPYIPGNETIVKVKVNFSHVKLGQLIERSAILSGDARITTDQALFSPAECEKIAYANVENKFEFHSFFSYLSELIALRTGMFINHLKAKNPAIRAYIANLFGRIRYKKGLDALILALQDKNLTVRQEAAAALAKIGNIKAIEPLNDALAVEKSDSAKKIFKTALTDLSAHIKVDEKH